MCVQIFIRIELMIKIILGVRLEVTNVGEGEEIQNLYSLQNIYLFNPTPAPLSTAELSRNKISIYHK